jgi:hypothetical protein
MDYTEVLAAVTPQRNRARQQEGFHKFLARIPAIIASG